MEHVTKKVWLEFIEQLIVWIEGFVWKAGENFVDLKVAQILELISFNQKSSQLISILLRIHQAQRE